MNDVIDAINSRIKSPYFGYTILAFFALNWRGIFVLATSEGDSPVRLAAFDLYTNNYTLVLYPLLLGAIVAASTHWIRYIFGLISRKPLELMNNQYLEAEHRKTIRQLELERTRMELFAAKEEELIERARRDEKVAEIEDIETKEKLTTQIEELREKQDMLGKLSLAAVEILTEAAKNKSGTILKPRMAGERSIHAGSTSLGAGDQREFARYEAGLNELIRAQLVVGIGLKGEIFELTHEGWLVADTL